MSVSELRIDPTHAPDHAYVVMTSPDGSARDGPRTIATISSKDLVLHYPRLNTVTHVFVTMLAMLDLAVVILWPCAEMRCLAVGMRTTQGCIAALVFLAILIGDYSSVWTVSAYIAAFVMNAMIHVSAIVWFAIDGVDVSDVVTLWVLSTIPIHTAVYAIIATYRSLIFNIESLT